MDSDLLQSAEHLQSSGGPRAALPPVQISGADGVGYGFPLRESVVVSAAEGVYGQKHTRSHAFRVLSHGCLWLTIVPYFPTLRYQAQM